jgi:hypothetical protein
VAQFLATVARPEDRPDALAKGRAMADHDQRFKSLLKAFFAEFFQVFFPAWADRFDFSGVDWLEQEDDSITFVALVVLPPRSFVTHQGAAPMTVRGRGTLLTFFAALASLVAVAFQGRAAEGSAGGDAFNTLLGAAQTKPA